MSAPVDGDFDTIRFGDPVVLLFRALFVVTTGLLVWDAVNIVPGLVLPSVRPNESVFSDCVSIGLFASGWVLVATLTLVVRRRRRRQSS